MIPFAAYTAAEIPIAFQRPDNSPKLPIPVVDLDFHLIHGSSDPFESTSL